MVIKAVAALFQPSLVLSLPSVPLQAKDLTVARLGGSATIYIADATVDVVHHDCDDLS
jgi:hypothetical protein